MKIGVVRRGFSPTGGAEAYLRRFAEAAVAVGHDLVLFTETWPESAWAFEHVAVRSGPPRRFADELVEIRAAGKCDFLFSLERVWSCDCYRAGDGVHAAWLERRARFEPGWRRLFRAWSPKHRGLLELERHLFGNDGARAVIANSQMVATEIDERFHYPAEKVHVIHNGVPESPIDDTLRAQVRTELGLGDDDYVLLFAGTGWERKGLRFAIEALNHANLPNARLLVAGRGSRHGLPGSEQVQFLGPVGDLPRYLAAADVYILPTIYDPFSNACLEAAAAGLPVITTRANGFSEIIEPGLEGEVVAEPDDISGLATAIHGWRDHQRRAAARVRLQALGKRYSIEQNVRQTLAVIESLRLRNGRSTD